VYKVRFTPAAERQLKKLSPQVVAQLQPFFESLALEPRPPGVKKMKNVVNRWRVRSGNYRIIYEIQDQQLIVLVINVGHRREVYQ
jgi:mRNA interferase RelE/StbE